jgi:N-acetylglucosaminyldiphosphoundecaprenol N-acetyl-beta-D-mannosaminyltransferase
MLTDDFLSCKFSLAGIRIDALKRGDLLRILDRARSYSDQALILNHNLHSLYLYRKIPEFRALYAKASWVYIDGMPVVWLSRLAGLPIFAEHRITLLDSFDAFLEEAANLGWRIFYLGSTQEVFSKGMCCLRSKHPCLEIQGRNGYIDRQGNENAEVISQINAYKPDLLLVGMGMPIQERWLLDNLPNLDTRAVITCGATLDYVTGDAYRPPSWVGPLGLYGVFRLFSDPVRLWRRYLLEPVILAWYLLIPILLQRVTRTNRNWISPKVVDTVKEQS